MHLPYNDNKSKYRRRTMNYLGLDYHKKYSCATIITDQGEIKEKERLLNRKEAFEEYLSSYRDVVAVVEACWNWPVAVELLDGLVEEVKLAHPSKVRLIAEARVKTDAIDSRTLAYLLRADLIPEAYLRDKENLQRQKVLRARCFYVKLRTQVKNRVHALVGGESEEVREVAKGYSDLFGKRGLQWLTGLELGDPSDKILKGLLRVYELLCEEIRKTDGLVKEIFETDIDCQLLESIPGIGKFFSVLICTEIGDIERFSSSSKLCSYAGIVPSTYASGGKLWHGKITKQGNRWLRWAMVEAVKPAISCNGELRSYYERIRYKKGPKAAKLATARRLLAIVYRVLKEKDSFKLYKNDIVGKAEPPSQITSAA
jgi:transposase